MQKLNIDTARYDCAFQPHKPLYKNMFAHIGHSIIELHLYAPSIHYTRNNYFSEMLALLPNLKRLHLTLNSLKLKLLMADLMANYTEMPILNQITHLELIPSGAENTTKMIPQLFTIIPFMSGLRFLCLPDVGDKRGILSLRSMRETILPILLTVLTDHLARYRGKLIALQFRWTPKYNWRRMGMDAIRLNLINQTTRLMTSEHFCCSRIIFEENFIAAQKESTVRVDDYIQFNNSFATIDHNVARKLDNGLY